jgi:hypothetical protein
MNLKRLVLLGGAILVSGGCASDRVLGPGVPETPAATAQPPVERAPTGASRISEAGQIDVPPEPMVIVDGEVYSWQHPRRDLEPEQIVRIEVIKPPRALQSFGPAGANGVILVTTKAGAANPSRAYLDPSGILHLTGNIRFSDQALVLVDGGVAPFRRLRELNPADVAEIQILGGPAAVDRYGPGAAAGVVLVRLKH